MKYPEEIPMLKTSTGQAVATLDEWQRAELHALIGDFGDIPSSPMIEKLMTKKQAFIDILSVKPKPGRPKGKKSKKPATPDQSKAA